MSEMEAKQNDVYLGSGGYSIDHDDMQRIVHTGLWLDGKVVAIVVSEFPAETMWLADEIAKAWNKKASDQAIENAAYERAAEIADKHSKALDHGNNEYLRSRDCQNAASEIRKMKSSLEVENHVHN